MNKLLTQFDIALKYNDIQKRDFYEIFAKECYLMIERDYSYCDENFVWFIQKIKILLRVDKMNDSTLKMVKRIFIDFYKHKDKKIVDSKHAFAYTTLYYMIFDEAIDS